MTDESQSFWEYRYNNFVDVYEKETDRAAAVLAGSYLETFLGGHIKSFLVDDPSVEELFVGYGPLASFSARINIAYALGLISKGIRKDLHYIRKIRNHFAHYSQEISFDSSPVRELCANLSMAQPLSSLENAAFRVVQPRFQYLFTVASIIIRVQTMMKKESRRSEP